MVSSPVTGHTIFLATGRPRHEHDDVDKSADGAPAGRSTEPRGGSLDGECVCVYNPNPSEGVCAVSVNIVFCISPASAVESLPVIPYYIEALYLSSSLYESLIQDPSVCPHCGTASGTQSQGPEEASHLPSHGLPPSSSTAPRFPEASSSFRQELQTTGASPQRSTRGKGCVKIVPPVSKRLACGDVGVGAMASVDSIVAAVAEALKERERSGEEGS